MPRHTEPVARAGHEFPSHEATTADLSPSFLRALRAMVDGAFDGDFADEDWAQALGGRHAWLAAADGTIVSHGSVVERRLDESIATRHELGVLSTGAHAFYARLGWVRWHGATWVDAPHGRRAATGAARRGVSSARNHEDRR